MKVKTDKNDNLIISLTIDEFKQMGFPSLRELDKVEFEAEFSEDGERVPVEITNSKYPLGIFIRVKEELDEEETFTEKLKRIEDWEIYSNEDVNDILEYCKSLWTYKNYFDYEPERIEDKEINKEVINVSTGGMSDNELIIEALQNNHLFWFISWYSSTRGGHYKFIKNNFKE